MRLVCMLGLGLAGCGTCGSQPAAPPVPSSTARTTPIVAEVAELGAPVAATAPDGTVVLQRGAYVDVRGPVATVAVQLPIGDDDPDRPYAVSAGGRYVARLVGAEDDAVVVWSIAPAAQAARIESGPSWGPPSFVEPELLATLGTDGVTLWELPAGRRRCATSYRGITRPRDVMPFGAGRALVRSSSNTPGIENATLVEISTADCDVTAVYLATPARELVRATAAAGTKLLLTKGRIRAFEGEAAVELALPRETTAWALASSPDGAVVAWAGHATLESTRTVFGVWLRREQRVAIVADLEGELRPFHLRIDQGALHAIGASGRTWRWPLPRSTEGRAAQVRSLAGGQLDYEDAIMALGVLDLDTAQRALDAITDPAARAASTFVRGFVESLRREETQAAFVARAATEGVRFAGDPATLTAAETLADAEVTAAATDALLAWLEGSEPRRGDPRGLEVGLELALQLTEMEERELREVLVRELARAYPDDAVVRRELEELEPP